MRKRLSVDANSCANAYQSMLHLAPRWRKKKVELESSSRGLLSPLQKSRTGAKLKGSSFSVNASQTPLSRRQFMCKRLSVHATSCATLAQKKSRTRVKLQGLTLVRLLFCSGETRLLELDSRPTYFFRWFSMLK